MAQVAAQAAGAGRVAEAARAGLRRVAAVIRVVYRHGPVVDL